MSGSFVLGVLFAALVERGIGSATMRLAPMAGRARRSRGVVMTPDVR